MEGPPLRELSCAPIERELAPGCPGALLDALHRLANVGLGGTELLPGGRCADTTIGSRAAANNVGVDCTANAVVQLEIHFGDLVSLVDAGVFHVPHGSGLDHVLDPEAFDSFVLRNSPVAVVAPDVVDVAPSTPVLSSVPALL